MSTDDTKLMSRVAGGDLDAFDQLVERYQHAAVNIAYRMLSDEHAAADAVQEAFLRVLDKSKDYKPTAKFSTFFYSILRNICIDYYRKKKPDYLPDFEYHEKNSELPVDGIIRKEKENQIHKAISELPERQKTALLLKHFEEMSYKDIAEIMDCSESAVDSLLIRARRKLETLLSNIA